MKFLTLMLGGILTFSASAQPLSTQLLHFFQQREPDYADNLSVTLLSLTPNTFSCDQPQLQLANHSRRWGALTLTARCQQQVAVARVAVKVSGYYYQSRQQIKQGTLVQPQQIERCYGRLDRLPTNSWLTPPPLPLVALQSLPVGKVLLKSQFRPPWVIQRGETVTLTFGGKGFTINSRATALDNAAVHQSLRVRLKNGQLLTAWVASDGTLKVQ